MAAVVKPRYPAESWAGLSCHYVIVVEPQTIVIAIWPAAVEFRIKIKPSFVFVSVSPLVCVCLLLLVPQPPKR